MRPRWIVSFTAALCLGLLSLSSSSSEPETLGQIATLPPIGDHWVFVPDRLLEHSLLFDGDRGEMLGSIQSSALLTPKLPLVSRTRGEIYSVDLAYDRGHRGNRVDYVTIHDSETLRVVGEILLPHPTSSTNASLHLATLLDGDRFLVVFSQFPATLATIVDLEQREVVAEVSLAGCAGLYAAGPDRFATLCGNGTAALALLDEAGSLRQLVVSKPFFDVIEDPVAMAGARSGSRWWFASFEGKIHEIDFGKDEPEIVVPWPLTTDVERADGWRPGGLQPVALHAASQRLFVVMHRGEAGSHKDPGPEIWTYDAAQRQRVGTIEVPNLAADFLGPLLGIDAGGFAQRMLRMLVPNEGAQSIAVTQDAKPLLFARHGELGVVAVLDALSGEHLRNLDEVGLAGPSLGVP